MVKKPGRKDLPPKSSTKVKAGGWTQNDNTTLVRDAKPKKRDLPPKKTVKAGLKQY